VNGRKEGGGGISDDVTSYTALLAIVSYFRKLTKISKVLFSVSLHTNNFQYKNSANFGYFACSCIISPNIQLSEILYKNC